MTSEVWSVDLVPRLSLLCLPWSTKEAEEREPGNEVDGTYVRDVTTAISVLQNNGWAVMLL